MSADRLVVSMAASAFLASAGWVSMTWLPTPDCTAITLIAWATTSCSSRAIRSLSSTTAWRARSSRSRSRDSLRSLSAAQRARRCRRFSPPSQNTMTASSDEIHVAWSRIPGG